MILVKGIKFQVVDCEFFSQKTDYKFRELIPNMQTKFKSFLSFLYTSFPK